MKVKINLPAMIAFAELSGAELEVLMRVAAKMQPVDSRYFDGRDVFVMSTRGHESITATVDPQAVTYTAIEFAEAEAEAVRIKAAEAEQARLDRANLVMALIEEDVEDNDEARAALIQLLDAQGVLRYRETEKVNSWLITDDEVIFMTTTYTGETIRVVVGVNGQVLREAI